MPQSGVRSLSRPHALYCIARSPDLAFCAPLNTCFAVVEFKNEATHTSSAVALPDLLVNLLDRVEPHVHELEYSHLIKVSGSLFCALTALLPLHTVLLGAEGIWWSRGLGKNWESWEDGQERGSRGGGGGGLGLVGWLVSVFLEHYAANELVPTSADTTHDACLITP